MLFQVNGLILTQCTVIERSRIIVRESLWPPWKVCVLKNESVDKIDYRVTRKYQAVNI